jgi:hypothetical protein
VETPPRPSILRKKPLSEGQSDETNPPNKKEGNRKEVNTPLPPKSGEVPYPKIIDAWNTLKPELLPKAELTDKRKPKIKAAWKEHPDVAWFEALFADISLSSWHSHRDRWQGCSFDWILKNRIEMREKLDALKKSNGGSRHPPVNAPPDEPPGILVPTQGCPHCGGKGVAKAPPGAPDKYEPCKCLHPVNEVKNEPSQPTQATASTQ